MKNTEITIGVIGCGSMGKRHLRNVKKLLSERGGGEVIAYDANPDAAAAASRESGVCMSGSLAELLDKADGVFICTPNHSHIPLAIEAVQHGCHALVEKPLSHSLENVEALLSLSADRGHFVTVGYMMRFYPPLLKVKEILEQGKLGTIYGARMEFGLYLPGWRPTMDYRKNYGAIRAQGGGVILDVIHEINYAKWLFGPIAEVFSVAGKLSSLEIDTEDFAEIVMKGVKTPVISLHLDYLQPSYSRSCKIYGEKSTLVWDFVGHTVRLFNPESKQWESIYAAADYDINEAYLAEERHFLDCVEQKNTPLITAAEAREDVSIGLAALQSAEQGKPVKISEVNALENKSSFLLPSRQLAGERIYLRELEEQDATPEYQSWLEDPEVNKYLVARNLSLEQIRTFICEKKRDPQCVFWGIFLKENGAHLGNLKIENLDVVEGKATVGILIGNKQYWNKGIGTEAMQLAMQHCFQTLGLRELNLGVMEDHAAAIKMYEKLGFVKEKINHHAIQCGDCWHNQIIMKRRRDQQLAPVHWVEPTPRQPVEIIAEVAQGYEGNPKLLELLTKGALEAGADAVKFQLVFADELATPDYHYYQLFTSLEMPEEEWEKTVHRIHEAGKKVYFDIYGLKSLELAKRLEADGIKLSTTEFYNTELLQEALQKFSWALISVGGIPLPDIQQRVAEELDILKLKQASTKICFLLGFQAEPTLLESNNLLRIPAFKKLFPQFQVGFMDHSLGTAEDALTLPIMALATGISCIEKHITLDPLLKVEDYTSALTPSDFQEFVRRVRKYEQALGSESLKLGPLEEEYRRKAVKVVVATKQITAGTVLTPEHVQLKRVGEQWKGKPLLNSLSAVVGKKMNTTIPHHHPILNSQVEEGTDKSPKPPASHLVESATAQTIPMPRRRKLVAALACRNDGSRLFGKPLQNLDIAQGITILDQLILTLKHFPEIEEIVLGISQGVTNEIFKEYARKHKVSYIIGDEEDVLKRLIQCGEAAAATDIFRVTTESPFIYFEQISAAWQQHLREENDATFADHVPDSANFEIIRLDALRRSHGYGERQHRSELCSLYIREHRHEFRVGMVPTPKDLRRQDIRLTVDHPEDLVLCRAVYQYFKEKAPLIPLQEIITFLETRPELLRLIAPFCQEGYSSMYK